MESTMHNVVSVTIGNTHRLEKSGAHTREMVITARSGERLILTLFADCSKELRVIDLDDNYPSHSLRAA